MKQALDSLVNNSYPELRAYAVYFLNKVGSRADPDTVINNSYIHVASMPEQTTTRDQVKSYLLNTIKCQVLWTTSKSHRDDRITAIEPFSDPTDDDRDLLDKVSEDMTYSNRKAIIEIHRATISDTVERIVFEAYIDKGYVTARSMATYFGITATSSHYLIKSIKQKLNEN